ncbi:MAG: S-layer homology domain-containing protein, partial [bacterium]|nr:S-layer homology domain-containing protein [bacterium]
CPSILCSEAPPGCQYVPPYKTNDQGCQVNCGKLICESQPPEDQCSTMRCENGCKDGQCIKPAAPRVCKTRRGTYQVGDTFTAEDGCNKCYCNPDTTISCTEMACNIQEPQQACFVDGQQYWPGDSFIAADGCNKCFCSESGQAACTKMFCPEPQEPPHGPDHGCYSSQDCGAGTVCSVDFGDCIPPRGDPALDVCTGFCMRKEFAYPEVLPKCESQADCSGGRVCTKGMKQECLEECPLSKSICMMMCDGRCIIPDIDSDYDDWNSEEPEVFEDVGECSFLIMCQGPQGMYEVQACDAAGNRVQDPCGGNYDFDYGMRPIEPEFEEEVITTPIENRFEDVQTGTLEGTAANALASDGVIGGFPDGTFRGDNPVNRAEAAKFLLMARYGLVNDARNDNLFLDVLEGEWYVKYVVQAAEYDIISGYSDRTFRPANTVNTAEFLKMLSKTFGLPQDLSHDYTDVPDGAWFAKYAGAAQVHGLFPGRPIGQLQPEKLLTRGEVAIAIYKLMENQ